MQNLYSRGDEHGGTQQDQLARSLQPRKRFFGQFRLFGVQLSAFGPIGSARGAGGAGAPDALGGACRKCPAGGEIDYFLTSRHPCPLKDKSGGEVGVCRGCEDGSSGAAAARLLF
jgi:hypothetical protein